MYERIIRDVIESCYAQYGWPPRKIAVTVMFFQQLRSELRQNNMTYDDPSKEVDIVFGGHTRVYASPGSDHFKRVMNIPEHIVAWEVSIVP